MGISPTLRNAQLIERFEGEVDQQMQEFYEKIEKQGQKIKKLEQQVKKQGQRITQLEGQPAKTAAKTAAPIPEWIPLFMRPLLSFTSVNVSVSVSSASMSEFSDCFRGSWMVA